MTRLFALALICILFSGGLRAADHPAELRLRSAVDQVVAIVKVSRDRPSLIRDVRPPLQKILDFSVMTRRSIGPGWRQFTPDQQKEAVSLFTTLILRTYTAKFTPGVYPAVEYRSVAETAPGRVEVTTTSEYKGSRYDVVYRMENQTGAWVITDVVIEGVSLVADYRSQFEATFQQGGASAVLGALRQSTERSQ
jgi:phospholipid transport system substrate-binding protein